MEDHRGTGSRLLLSVHMGRGFRLHCPHRTGLSLSCCLQRSLRALPIAEGLIPLGSGHSLSPSCKDPLGAGGSQFLRSCPSTCPPVSTGFRDRGHTYGPISPRVSVASVCPGPSALGGGCNQELGGGKGKSCACQLGGGWVGAVLAGETRSAELAGCSEDAFGPVGF